MFTTVGAVSKHLRFLCALGAVVLLVYAAVEWLSLPVASDFAVGTASGLLGAILTWYLGTQTYPRRRMEGFRRAYKHLSDAMNVSRPSDFDVSEVEAYSFRIDRYAKSFARKGLDIEVDAHRNALQGFYEEYRQNQQDGKVANMAPWFKKGRARIGRTLIDLLEADLNRQDPKELRSLRVLVRDQHDRL